ncbi:MAG TPA: DUF5615 family PIN-like protein [Candidatus Acidoferrales bacterium]|nr:DUF5615 family PIN-like protein [Candidatus Acidoferrales bacterium]
MKILLDECIPRSIKSSLSVEGHECSTVPEAGLAGKTNGELLRLAEGSFEVFVTLDRGMPYQQNLAGYNISVVLIRTKSSRVADILPHIPSCLLAFSSIKPGQIIEIGES